MVPYKSVYIFRLFVVLIISFVHIIIIKSIDWECGEEYLMLHDIEIIKKDLVNLDPSIFATKWFFDTIPFVFEEEYSQYIQWRHELSEKINIDPCDIIITGSAGLGISLNPNKNFKPFDSASDIDICIFSEYYFSVAWHDLLGLSLAGSSYKMITAIKEHRNKYIYWGTIATDIILPVLSFGAEWARIIPKINGYVSLRDHEIHFRIYKDRQAFRRYLLNSLINRKTALLEGR